MDIYIYAHLYIPTQTHTHTHTHKYDEHMQGMEHVQVSQKR